MVLPMFCQSCGAENTAGAKFCNQCGSKIAQAGEPGGVVDTVRGGGAGRVREVTQPTSQGEMQRPAAGSESASSVGGYNPGALDDPNAMSVSLAAIGVRSSKKTWGTIIVVAGLLVGLGAAAAMFLQEEPAEDAGHASAEDPMVIGTPLPVEEAALPEAPLPEEVEPSGMASSMGRRTPMRSTMRASMASTMSSAMGAATMAGSGSNGSGSGSSQGSGSNGLEGSGSSGSEGGSSSGSNGSGSGDSGESGSSGSEGSGSDGSGSSGAEGGGSDGSGSQGTGSEGSGSTMGSSMEGSSMAGSMLPSNVDEELPPERDLRTSFYTSNVRTVIRRYYVPRVRSCFDRATRNTPSLSGTVVVNMTVGGDGNVSRATVGRNTTGNELLGRCLAGQVSTWRLPPPPDGEPIQMQMPFSR